MKLEPNMYVRIKWGNGLQTISKCTNKVDMGDTQYSNNDFYIHTDIKGEVIYKSMIVKASHNIIDLIEEKDLLEIEYFSLRYEKRVTRLFEVTYKEGRFINLDNAKCQFMLIDNDWTDNDKELEPIIKSIVTKEMFSSMEYRLGDDK